MIKYIKELVSYGLVGVLTTIINLITFKICLAFLGISISTFLSGFIAIMFSYFANKKWVFVSEVPMNLKEFLGFVSSRLVCIFLEVAIMQVLVNVCMLDSLLSKLISNIFVVLLNYIIGKFFIFK